LAQEPGKPKLDPVIILFKPKDQRENRARDKLDVVRAATNGRITDDALFFEGARHVHGHMPAIYGTEHPRMEVTGFETPIVCVSLTPAERERLARHPDVEIVEDDVAFDYAHVGRAKLPRVQGMPTLEEETIPRGVAAISAPTAWGNSQGKGIRVAVLDTGIDDSHPDLAANVVGGVGFVPGTPGERDDEGHGTFCAGIIGAGLTGSGIVGVAPQVSLFAVKVSDQTGQPSLRTIIAGLDWCIANNIHIVSMSFGFPEPSLALYAMCQRTWAAGILLVASVGNDGGPWVTYPAGFDNVIGVGAIDAHNVHYAQSNRGLGLNLSAPGVDVLSTGLRGTYGAMSGTSAAAPHVAGAAAVVWGAHRFATNAQIWHLLARTARPLGKRNRYGLGRVNVLAASAAMEVPQAVPLSGRSFRAGLNERGLRTAIPTEVRDADDRCARG
jgi:subtilisin